MHDAEKIMKAVKRAANEAMTAAKPVEWCFGKVTSISPLRILVEQKMILGRNQLVLSRNVTDYEVNVSITAENGVETKKTTVHNGLAVGDEVILLRQQGGQKYLVWDKVGVS